MPQCPAYVSIIILTAEDEQLTKNHGLLKSQFGYKLPISQISQSNIRFLNLNNLVGLPKLQTLQMRSLMILFGNGLQNHYLFSLDGCIDDNKKCTEIFVYAVLAYWVSC